jgi:hypothetical protein
MRELEKFEVATVNGGEREDVIDDPDFPQPDIGNGRYEVFSQFSRQLPMLPPETNLTPVTRNLIWHAWPVVPDTPPFLQ